MPSIFSKLRTRSKKDKDPSRSSSPTPSVGRPSTSQIPGESEINLDLVTTPIVNRPSDSAGEKKKQYLAAGITVLKHLKEISEASGVLAPLKAACGATTAILETIEAMDNNKEAWKDTLQTIQRHQKTFKQQLKNMGAQNVPPDAEPGLLDPIQEYGKDLESILGAIMLENGISATTVPQEFKFRGLITFMKRYGTVKVEAETISGYNSQLDGAIKQFTESMTVYMGYKLHSVGQELRDLHQLVQSSSTTNKVSSTASEIKLKPRPRPVLNFVGREDILAAMRKAHFNSHQVQQQSTVITILSGIGGLGKTQTALKFALEFEQEYPEALVCFMDASAPEKLQADLETVIRSRGTEYHSKSYQDALVWLATDLKNWLVILDNVDDPNMDPVPYIPQCAHGHIIITTRNATLAALAPDTSHALEGLSVSDAIALLLTASKYPDDEENRSMAQSIVIELGCLPLALAHAAGYIFVHRCLKTYLDMYRRNREKILASTNSKLLHEYRSSVSMTIEMSLEKLTERARDTLRLLSHLSATSIPLSVIAKPAERRFRHVVRTEDSSLNPETLKQADVLMTVFCPGGGWSEFDFNEPIHECFQYSLLQLTTQNDEKFYSMHVLVQSHLQGTGLIHNHHPRRLVCRLLGSAVTIERDYEFLAFNRLLLPHIRLVQIEDVTEAGDHRGLGYVLNEVGDTRLAIVHREKCVEIWRELLGKEDERTIAAMHSLAISYKNAGKNQEALELRQQVLSIRQRLLGPEHLDTVKSMKSLASSYRNLGKYQAALELEEEVLSLRRRLLGPEHPGTLHTMINLALSYKKLGKDQAALELEEEVLSLQRSLLGPEHPDTVLVMSNLAISYKKLGNNQAALELGEEALSLQRKVLGQHHKSSLSTMWNLLNTYNDLNMQAQRLDLLRTAVPTYEASESRGPNHSDTAYLRNELNQLSARLANGGD